jgi:hypothetical protein
MTQNSIKFQTSNNTLNGWVMRITADRRIEVNEAVEVTEAAKKVLEAMQLMLDNQKRTWVGLTDEERKSFWTADQMSQQEWDALFNAIEAKLKEKNT